MGEPDLGDLLAPALRLRPIEIPLGWTLAAAEREIIMQTLAAHRGNRQETATALAISRRTLYAKLARYGAADSATPASGRDEDLAEDAGEDGQAPG